MPLLSTHMHLHKPYSLIHQLARFLFAALDRLSSCVYLPKCFHDLFQSTIYLLIKSMFSPTPTTLFIIPTLTLISIPLVISAYITTILSILTLCIRLFVIYIELCYAIITNYFIIPTTPDSLLTFSPSEPTSPPAVSRRLSTTSNASVSSGNYHHAHRRAMRANLIRINNAVSGYGYDSGNHRPVHANSRGMKGTTTTSPQPPFMGFVSGDEGRDFEDIGGWRYLAPSTSQPNLDGSMSPSSDPNANTSDNTEERAWLSINQRLELPSHLLTLGDRTISDPSNWLFSTVSSPTQPHQRRHHKRSHTTSMLFPSSRSGGGLSRALSTRPDTPSTRSTPSTPGLREVTSPRLVAPSQGGDGYFPPQVSSGEIGPTSGTTSPRMTGSVEDRGAGVGRFMAHYPAGVRHRRRSVSGIQRALGRDGV